MRNIQMLALDLDGTLLRSDKTISPRSLSALAGCRQMGISIVVITARSLLSAKRYTEIVRPQGIISCGGALAHWGNDTVYRRTLSASLADALIRELKPAPARVKATLHKWRV